MLYDKRAVFIVVKIRKCGIIGLGFVGSSIAFSLMQAGLFSEMVLIDANGQKAIGEAMDLSHGLSYAKPAKIYAGTYADLTDCSLIIITAGANQAPGETRLDLVAKNAKILKSIIPQITEYNRECILLIVSNPVDILTYVALKLSGFPANRVIGSGTVLDTGRLKYLIGDHLQVDSRNVHSFVIGEHGDSELPVWSSANVSGIDLVDFCKDCGKCENMSTMNALFEDVRSSAYKIIEYKKATYYGIAMATLKIAECIMRDEKSVLPVSALAEGHYGLHDICLSLPAVIGINGIERVLDIPLDEKESANLNKSAETLRNILSQIEL